MKKIIQIFMAAVLALSILVSCDNSKNLGPTRRNPSNPVLIEKGS